MHLSCEAVSALQWISAISAFLAAVFWFLASIVKLPKPQITFESIDHIVPALQRQGRLSAAAAICAAVAAAIQAVLIVTPTCINLG